VLGVVPLPLTSLTPPPPLPTRLPRAHMELLPAELFTHVLRFVPTACGEAYRSGAGWVACELAG